MIIGFTGTRRGMTWEQKQVVVKLFVQYKPTMAVHGDCIGADHDFHEIARSMSVSVRVRPCTLEAQRAYSDGAIETFPPEAPRVRNEKIVRDSDLMIATPTGFTQVPYSGTWMTINIARKMGRSLIIVWPNGEWVFEKR